MNAEMRRFWWAFVLLVLLWCVLSPVRAGTASVAAANAGYNQGIWNDVSGSGYVTWSYNSATRTLSGVAQITNNRGGGQTVMALNGGNIAVANAAFSSSSPVQISLAWETTYTLTLNVIVQGVAFATNSTTFNTGSPPGSWNADLKNKTDSEVTYKFVDGCSGTTLGEKTVGAGESLSGTVVNKSGCDVLVYAKTYGKRWDAATQAWIIDETPQWHESYVGKLGKSTSTVYTEDVAGGGSPVTSPLDTTGASDSAGMVDSGESASGNGGVRSVAYKPIFTSAETTASGYLDNVTAIKGFNGLADAQSRGSSAVVDALAKVENAVKSNTGSGGSGGSGSVTVNVDNSGVTSRLDAIKTEVAALNARDQERKTQEDARIAANPTLAAMQAAGAEAGSNAAAVINGQGGSAPNGLGYDPVGDAGGYDTMLQVSMPAAFGGATFDFNPFSRPGLLSVAHWFREATRWLALVTLGIWAWAQMAEWVRGLSTIRQATGNAVAAGTGAQATALIAAGLITVAIVVASTALMAWTFGNIGFGALREASGLNPLVGMSSAVVGFLGEIFPIATLLSCLVAKFTFNFYASAIFSTCAAVVRFVVP